MASNSWILADGMDNVMPTVLNKIPRSIMIVAGESLSPEMIQTKLQKQSLQLMESIGGQVWSVTTRKIVNVSSAQVSTLQKQVSDTISQVLT